MNNSPGSETKDVRHASTPIEDEISLYDLWAALVRQRRLVIAVWVLSVLGAATYVVLTPNVFESHSIVRFAHFASGSIDSPGDVKLLLEEEYRVGQSNQTRPRLSSILVPAEGSDAIALTAEAYSPIEAKRYLDSVTQKLAATQQRRYAAATKVVEGDLAEVQRRLDEKNPTSKPVTEMNNSQVPELLRLRSELRLRLSPPQTYEATITPPTLPATPISPRPIMVLALAAILGGMLSVLIAFAVESIQSMKARRQG